MSLAARRTVDTRDKPEIDMFDLVELAERTHRHCPGPMILCGEDDCRSWVDALSEWGVIR